MDPIGESASTVEHLERIVNLGQTWISPEEAQPLLNLAFRLDVHLFGRWFTAPSTNGPVLLAQVWANTPFLRAPLPMAVASESEARPLGEILASENPLFTRWTACRYQALV